MDSNGQEFSGWTRTVLGTIIVPFTEKVFGDHNYEVLTSSRNGIQRQSEHFAGKQRHDTDGYNIIPRGYCTYRNRSDDGLFTFNMNNIVDEGIVSKFYPVFTFQNANSTFMMEYLNGSPRVRAKLSVLAVGTSQVVLSFETLKETSFYLPTFEEQNRIAALLSTLNERIEKQRLLIEHLKKYKRGVLEQFIATFQSNNASFVSLKEITQIYDGTHQTPNYQTHGVKFVSVENIESLLDTRKYISKEDFEKEFKISPSKGDVLMTRIGDIGRSSYVDFDTPIAFYVSLALFKCKNQLDGRYLAHYIMSNAFQEQLWKRTLHIAFPKKINTCEIGECEILLPSLDDQRHCAKLLDSIDLLINKNQKILEYLTTQRLGILQQIFI